MKILQISDMHIFDDPNDELLGVNTQRSFEAIVDLIDIEERDEKVDFILLTGDLSQDGSVDSYKRIASYLKPFEVPIYYIPGNHDHSEVINQVYPRDHILDNRRIIFPQWQFILLDSQKPGAVEGYLAKSELDFMQRCLIDCPDHRAVIVMHHQPVAVGSQWLDSLGVKNADEFWQVAAQFPNIHSVVFGHVHQEFQSILNNVHCIAAPSTCIQFKPKQDHFGLDNIPPGYRWFKFEGNGKFETGVRRWAYYVGEFKADAKGY